MVTKRKPEATPEWQPRRRLFTVDEYERMIEAGVLGRERIELIEGEIVYMAAIGARHSACLNRFYVRVQAPLEGRALVRIQMSIRLPPRVEPEPDLAFVRWREDFYEGGNPGPDDVLLLVEVSESSLFYDQRRKLPLYAAAGIREVWITDLVHDRALMHRNPRGKRYTEVITVERGGTLTPLAFPELTIALDDVLGPPAAKA